MHLGSCQTVLYDLLWILTVGFDPDGSIVKKYGVKEEMATQTEATLALAEDCVIDIVTDNEVELVIVLSYSLLIIDVQ
jgi:hypothetical protein